MFFLLRKTFLIFESFNDLFDFFIFAKNLYPLSRDTEEHETK